MQEVSTNMPAKDYHAYAALNKTAIEKLLRCPLEYKLDRDNPQEQTAPMAFGTLVHSVILEPETVEARYHVMKNSGTTKAGKAEKAQALEQGKTIVSQADWDKAQAMLANVRAHKACSWLLGLPGESEVSMAWELVTDDGFTRQCKGRADRIASLPEGRIIIDLKTTSGPVSQQELERTSFKWGWHRQAGWYSDGYDRLYREPLLGFYFVAVSTQPPYLCTAVKMSEQASLIGLQDCYRAEKILRQCEETGVWPSYADELVEIDLPAWVYRKAAEEAEIPAVPF